MFSMKLARLGYGKLFLLLLAVMVLAAILLALVLFYPTITGSSEGPWF